MGVRRLGMALVALFAASGCCATPWDVYPSATLPDRSCTTGGSVYGDDIYIWECLSGEKIVVSQYSSELVCRAPVREVLACGELSAFEADPTFDCTGARAGREWLPQ